MQTHEENAMSVASHVETLRMKHQSLSATVESMQKRPGVDTLEIVALKREKLRLKQQITRLAH